jgi:predicted PurR-regulated permease PerM
MQNTKTPYTFDKVVRLLIGLAIITALILLFRRLNTVLTPFFVGWMIAYLLHPTVKFFQHKLKFKSRILSVITTLVLFFGSFTGIILLIIPQIAKEVSRVSVLIQNFTQNLDIIGALPLSWQYAITDFFANINFNELISNPNITEVLKKIAPQLWLFLNSSLSFVLSMMVIIIVLLYLIFILMDYDKIVGGFPNIIPSKYRALVTGILNDIETGMSRYFRGQALIALIVGVLFAIGFVIIDLPMAIIFGIFVGILNLVPYLQTVAIVPGMFLVILKASEPGQSFGGVMLGILIVFAAVQLFQDLFLVPKIMGKVTGLKPAVILLSLSIWGSLMGIIGMIIALPLTTLIISYYKRWVLGGEDLLTGQVESVPEMGADQDIPESDNLQEDKS